MGCSCAFGRWLVPQLLDNKWFGPACSDLSVIVESDDLA